ncbi:MAG: CotH kinase family protein, partial [Ignavibacteria bacterium]
LYEQNGIKGFSIDAGIQIFGWGTRANAQKSFSIMIRDKYGFPELNYRLFPDNPINKFTSFVLRAGGNDWNKLFFRDAFAQSLVAECNLDLQDFRPAIVFINGEYWGIQNIREKLNEDYLESHWGINKDNVDIISRYWRRSYPVVIEGDDFAFLEMENFLAINDMKVAANYEYAKSVIDMDNLLDYLTAQIYFANYDWPGNNNKIWREKVPNAKWRWFMYDMDWTFGYDGNSSYSFNTLKHATNSFGSGWPNPAFTTLIFRRLFENKEFQREFVNRMADFLNTSFKEDFTAAKLSEMENLFRPEMPAHIQRWALEGGIQSLNSWDNELAKVEEFIEKRQTFIREHLIDEFNLGGADEINLNVNITNAGRIKVNTIVVDSFPWQGTYFNDVPIEISVLPNRGFRFAGWSGIEPSQQNQSSLTITINSELNLTAVFETDTHSLNSIVINEINYNSPAEFNPGDWIEIYNGFDESLDISSWKFKDLNPGNIFSIPQSVFIEPNKYLVICSDTASFKLKFPRVKNFLGNINFNFSNDGQHIQLLDDQNEIADSLTYDDIDAWPLQPDGTGPTLALINPRSDNSLPENWAPSIVDFGTPGNPNDQPLAVEGQDDLIPGEFVLYDNYPNPFNPITNFEFRIAHFGFVTLKIFDILGNAVATLVNEEKSAGKYTINFNAVGLATGVYFYQLKADGFVETKKLILLK